MRKCILIIGCVFAVLPCKKVKAQYGKKNSVGLTTKIGIKRNMVRQYSTFGFFYNHYFGDKTSVNFEVQRLHCGALYCKDASDENLVEQMLTRNWSASLSFNYYLKPVLLSNLKPYIGVGAGRYYIQESKSTIKKDRENAEEDSIEHNMRGYYRRPGLFGAAGLQLRARSNTYFFIQSKCSLLFEDNGIFWQPSNFTDLISITTGFRYILH